MSARSSLARLGRNSYWVGRWKTDRRKQRRASWRDARGAWASERREAIGIVLELAVQSLPAAASGLVIVAVAELIGWWISLARLGALDLITQRLVNDNFDVLAGAAVGAVATFLGLFYTTVGVVASTAYRSVPGEIRRLFVEERTSAIYVRGVVRALIVGLSLLLLGGLGYQPRGLSSSRFSLFYPRMPFFDSCFWAADSLISSTHRHLVVRSLRGSQRRQGEQADGRRGLIRDDRPWRA